MRNCKTANFMFNFQDCSGREGKEDQHKEQTGWTHSFALMSEFQLRGPRALSRLQEAHSTHLFAHVLKCHPNIPSCHQATALSNASKIAAESEEPPARPRAPTCLPWNQNLHCAQLPSLARESHGKYLQHAVICPLIEDRF